ISVTTAWTRVGHAEPQADFSPPYEDNEGYEQTGPLSYFDLLSSLNSPNGRNRRNAGYDNYDYTEAAMDNGNAVKGRDPCEGVYCHPNARCHKGRCHCEFGYEGDAKHNCDKVDLCKRLGCHAFARCHDGRCKCDPGYSGDGYRECIRADSAKGGDEPMGPSGKGESVYDGNGKGQIISEKGPVAIQPPSAKGETVPMPVLKGDTENQYTPDPDVHIGLPYSIDLLSFIPDAPKGEEFSSEVPIDNGPLWVNYKSPRRPLPAPLPIRTVFPTSYLPRELIHPISFLVEFSPYERSRPGRSFLLSRVDRHGRLRFAVAVNQWGNHGEYMELWIHHDNFFTARYDPVMGLQYSGGLMPTTGIATIPLPRAEPGTQKPIKISVELSDRDLHVYNGCPSDDNRIFSLYYSPRQNVNAGKGTITPPPVPAKGKGSTGSPVESEATDFTHDKIYLLSGGPVHNSRYRGLVRDMKLFFSRDGASRYCHFQQGSSPSNGKGQALAVKAAPAPPPPQKGDGAGYDEIRDHWGYQPAPAPVSPPSYEDKFMGLTFEQPRQKGGNQELCVRVTPTKGEVVRLEKVHCP
ncbi:hypothetical protein Ciccas_010168, partial [Cichlidogyrus casuarinus]